MKLLFDHNLSHKLVDRLADIFPDSTHTRLLGLSEASDTQVWQIAFDNQLTIVSQDADFLEMGLVKGFPPKLIWIRIGNSTTNEIEKVIRDNYLSIRKFIEASKDFCLELD